jgi:hypothetical protein
MTLAHTTTWANLFGLTVGIGSYCRSKASLYFDADSSSNVENGMYLVPIDSETGNITGDPRWLVSVGDFANGTEYNLDACLDENVCYEFLFYGES